MPKKKNAKEARIPAYVPQRQLQRLSYQQEDINARRVRPASEISPSMRYNTPHKLQHIRSIKDIISWLLNLFPF
jgi:hypothetical protein